MKLLLVTATDSKGIALGEYLSNYFDITVLHTLQVDFEFPFSEYIITDENALRNHLAPECDYIIYLSSEELPCNYLPIVLQSMNVVSSTRLICISESNINLSQQSSADTNRYICNGCRELTDRISFWKTAPIYGDDFLPPELTGIYNNYKRTNTIVLPGNEIDSFEAIHISDIGAAIKTYIGKSENYSNIFLTSHQEASLKSLETLFKSVFSQSKIVYQQNHTSASIMPTMSAFQTPEDYDSIDQWMPSHNFYEEFPHIINNIEQEIADSKSSLFAGGSKALIHICLFLVIFSLVCLYTGFMKVGSELQFVDFRLLFVIGSCLIWGRRYGLAAAVLCSMASIIQSVLGGTKWHILFFHIDNWIPVATYLASAVLFGMYRENKVKE